jgi:membrane-associated protease RseP (regulator of RpoE activity)
MGNQAPHIHEPQINDGDEEKIIQLLSALPRVKAPGDFGFRVKASIAKGKPSAATSSWVPTAVKAALPLMLLVLIGGYFAVTALYTTNDVPAPVVARQDEPAAPAHEQALAPVLPLETDREQNSTSGLTAELPDKSVSERPSVSTRPTITVDQVAVKKPTARPVATRDGSGSKEEAALITKELSKTNNPTVTPESPAKGERAGEVLTRIGINALFSESGWKAESVSPNTAAAKAGVKAGDVIESVDDQTMTDLGSVAKPAKGKKLRVLRDGKTVDIVIEP